jgi:hypothetical protein
MSETPNIQAFPAAKLGAFLRAMEDPEGRGQIDPARERDIAVIEERLQSASAHDSSAENDSD